MWEKFTSLQNKYIPTRLSPIYFYIYITNSINKHKKNEIQLVRILKFKHEGRGSNPLLSLLLVFFKVILAYFKKPASPLACGLIGRAAGLAF